jgi:hypothetical protein
MEPATICNVILCGLYVVLFAMVLYLLVIRTLSSTMRVAGQHAERVNEARELLLRKANKIA